MFFLPFRLFVFYLIKYFNNRTTFDTSAYYTEGVTMYKYHYDDDADDDDDDDDDNDDDDDDNDDDDDDYYYYYTEHVIFSKELFFYPSKNSSFIFTPLKI